MTKNGLLRTLRPTEEPYEVKVIRTMSVPYFCACHVYSPTPLCIGSKATVLLFKIEELFCLSALIVGKIHRLGANLETTLKPSPNTLSMENM